MSTQMCNCGCNRKAVYLTTGVEYDPSKSKGMGRTFKDVPTCESAARYGEETAWELKLPFSKRPIGAKG